MKRRTLKKWIPKDTIYCYYDGKYHGRSGECRFYADNKNVTEEQKEQGCGLEYNEGYCKLLGVEIFDMCKACGVSKSGWFKLSDYSGCSSHFLKKMRDWKRTIPNL